MPMHFKKQDGPAALIGGPAESRRFLFLTIAQRTPSWMDPLLPERRRSADLHLDIIHPHSLSQREPRDATAFPSSSNGLLITMVSIEMHTQQYVQPILIMTCSNSPPNAKSRRPSHLAAAQTRRRRRRARPNSPRSTTSPRRRRPRSERPLPSFRSPWRARRKASYRRAT